MSFGKPRFDKAYTYELIRYCTISGVTVVGGMSKMLNYFKSKFGVSDILCYSDASIAYNKSDVMTSPNYIWWHCNTGLYFTRYQTMKHLLPKLLDKFDNNLTEFENMVNNKYLCIYDAGNYKTIL